VHTDIPVAAEVILEARNPKEAGVLAENIVKQTTVMERLHKTLGTQTITIPNPSNQQINVRLESLLHDIGAEAMAWKMVDLDSGEHWEPEFRSLIYKPPVVKSKRVARGRVRAGTGVNRR
jgi:hypothetical protein